jgi:PhzF family phenazine biosynthesis protein
MTPTTSQNRQGTPVDVLRYSAFSADPAGGNPAGVVLDAQGLSDARMLDIAAEVGFSETAFLIERPDHVEVRYFSPLAEVPFCGHATIASAVARAERYGAGTTRYDTRAGIVEVSTERGDDGMWRAALISVPPTTSALAHADLDALLGILGWNADDLDPMLPAQIGDAGARHPIIAAASHGRLAVLDYDMVTLARLMAARDWTTINLVWRESESVLHARNPFPPGGVVEDPATGAAAAALGGYLRAGHHVNTPATLTVHQGTEMGRPSILTVDIPADPTTGIRVSGTAVPIPAP